MSIVSHARYLPVLALLLSSSVAQANAQKTSRPCLSPKFGVAREDDLFRGEEYEDTIPTRQVSAAITVDPKAAARKDMLSDVVLVQKGSGRLFLNKKYLEYLNLTSDGFSGKINTKNINKLSFYKLLLTLFSTGAVDTYRHLRADGCLVEQDLLNPSPRGARLVFNITHAYCTSECRSDTYQLYVSLNNQGAFVGYVDYP